MRCWVQQVSDIVHQATLQARPTSLVLVMAGCSVSIGPEEGGNGGKGGYRVGVGVVGVNKSIGLAC